MDSWLEEAYEDRSGFPDDPAEGYEYFGDDETDDADIEWPSQAERDAYRPEEPLTDDEWEKIDYEWARWGDEQDLMS